MSQLRLFKKAGYLLLTGFLASCGASEKKGSETVISDSLKLIVDTAHVTAPSSENNGSPSNTAIVPAASSVAETLNPPHGEPGHRCDIAVGAPLDSKAAPVPVVKETVNKEGTGAIIDVKQPATAPVTPVTTSTANGLNPPHGQPGHRCDIAVGQPLNSKPATTTTTAVTPQVQTISTPTPIINPVQPTTTASEGMNPEHGKPGHRCDIPVGAPLNSAPVKKN